MTEPYYYIRTRSKIIVAIHVSMFLLGCAVTLAVIGRLFWEAVL